MYKKIDDTEFVDQPDQDKWHVCTGDSPASPCERCEPCPDPVVFEPNTWCFGLGPPRERAPISVMLDAGSLGASAQLWSQGLQDAVDSWNGAFEDHTEGGVPEEPLRVGQQQSLVKIVGGSVARAYFRAHGMDATIVAAAPWDPYRSYVSHRPYCEPDVLQASQARNWSIIDSAYIYINTRDWAFNGMGYHRGTAYQYGTWETSVQQVLIHELGHSLGLRDYPRNCPYGLGLTLTMCSLVDPNVNGNIWREPSTEDDVVDGARCVFEAVPQGTAMP